MRKSVLALACIALLPASSLAEDAHPYAIFAGGCFWSIEKAFDHAPGVISAVSGFTGGTVKNPSYDEVVAGHTGHVEAVKVTYDPAKTSYDQLLAIYWHQADLTNIRGQFCDYGAQYRTEIFYVTPEQKTAAQETRDALAKSGEVNGTIVTKILPAKAFYPAEAYHQNFADKNPDYYAQYREGCRRDARLAAIWNTSN